MTDIHVSIGETTLNCRVAAIITKGSKILLHKTKDDAFWGLVGGKIMYQETSRAAIARELKEELAVDVHAERLLVVAENFFAFKGKQFHEFCFVYQIDDGDNAIPSEEAFVEQGLMYRWFDKNELPYIEIKPTFLKPILLDMPSQLQHIIHAEPH